MSLILFFVALYLFCNGFFWCGLIVLLAAFCMDA